MFTAVSKQIANPMGDEAGAIIPNHITIEFVNQGNKAEYKKTVLTWLEDDFNRRERPNNHFWHNCKTIEEAFDKCDAMLILNNEGEFIGYMIWSFYSGIGAEIDIIEIKENYRRQGALKKALAEFANKFTDIYVLSANVLPQAERAFCSAGWKKLEKRYMKIIKPVLQPFDTLPDGQVMAVSSVDYYMVKENPEKYKDSMKYFQIRLDKNKQLHEPIITEFNYEGYIGVYLNKNLIAHGKAKHLFKSNEISYTNGDLLVLPKFIPQNLELFKSFFSESQAEPQQEAKNEDTSIMATNPSNSALFNTPVLIFSQPIAPNDTALNNDLTRINVGNIPGNKRIKDAGSGTKLHYS